MTEFINIFFVTYLTTQQGTMRLYFDHCWTETVNGKRLVKQENDLSEVGYFQGPKVSTMQSKTTTNSFERAFNLDKKEETSTKMLVIIDFITKRLLFQNVLTKVIIINTSMLFYFVSQKRNNPQN